jgi:hypothetical protein
VFLPYCINLGQPSLWDADETFYAETLREMLETGDCIAPIYPMMAVLLGGLLDRTLAGAPESGPNRKRALWIRAFMTLAVLGLGLSIFSFFLLSSLCYAGSCGRVTLCADCHLVCGILGIGMERSVREAFALFHQSRGSAVGRLYAIFIAFLPAVELSLPVKEICKAIQTLARPGDEAGYFRTTVPSMVYYLRVLLNGSNTVEEELLLVSNRPDLKTGAHECHETP